MANFKIVIGTKQGKCLQKEIAEKDAGLFLGKRIGDTIKGDALGFAGYEFQVTGGSDNAGFPMRLDVEGPVRRKILAVEGTGVKKQGKGQLQRKIVFGNTISTQISQINLKVTKEGKEKLIEEKKEEAADASKEKPQPEKPEEAPASKAAKPEKPSAHAEKEHKQEHKEEPAKTAEHKEHAKAAEHAKPEKIKGEKSAKPGDA